MTNVRRTAVRDGDGTDDGDTKPEPAVRPRLLEPNETLEYSLAVRRYDTRTVVGDDQASHVALAADADANAHLGVSASVANEVVEKTLQPWAVAGNEHGPRRRGIQRDAPIAGDVDHVGGESTEIDPGRAERRLLVQASQHQQIADERIHPIHLRKDVDGELTPPQLVTRCRGQLGCCPDRRKRRP